MHMRALALLLATASSALALALVNVDNASNTGVLGDDGTSNAGVLGDDGTGVLSDYRTSHTDVFGHDDPCANPEFIWLGLFEHPEQQGPFYNSCFRSGDCYKIRDFLYKKLSSYTVQTNHVCIFYENYFCNGLMFFSDKSKFMHDVPLQYDNKVSSFRCIK